MGILRKNNRRGVSIKYKFILFILIVVLIIVCSVGSVCYSMLSSVLVNDITNEMNLIVGKDASLINEKLYRMKDAADSVNTYVINSIESAYDLADPTYRQQFQQQFESVFVSTSQNTQVLSRAMSDSILILSETADRALLTGKIKRAG